MLEIIRLFAVALLGTAGALAQSTIETDVLALKQSWAEINYRIADKAARVAAFEALQPRAHALSEKYSQRAEPLIWERIVYSSYAEAKGSVGALGAAKTARRLFESAVAIDAKALDGLGTRQSRCAVREGAQVSDWFRRQEEGARTAARGRGGKPRRR